MPSPWTVQLPVKPGRRYWSRVKPVTKWNDLAALFEEPLADIVDNVKVVTVNREDTPHIRHDDIHRFRQLQLACIGTKELISLRQSIFFGQIAADHSQRIGVYGINLFGSGLKGNQSENTDSGTQIEDRLASIQGLTNGTYITAGANRVRHHMEIIGKVIAH